MATFNYLVLLDREQKYIHSPLLPAAARLLMLQSVDDPVSAYRHWKSFNANESNFQRLCRYYEARAEDHTRIDFRFRQSGMIIHIFIHQRVPVREFKVLLARFFRIVSHESVFGDKNIEMRVGDLEEDSQFDLHSLHADYKILNANETNFKRLCRYYGARAEDQSWIFFQFSPTRMTVYIIVHKRVPLQEFHSLLANFYHQRSYKDVVGNGNVEFRIHDRRHPDQDHLGDWQIDNSEDPDDEAVKVDNR